MAGLAAGTIVTKSYLALARVLAASFARHHPEVPFFALLVDEPDGCFDPEAEPFPVVRLADLDVPDLARLRFRYPLQSTAAVAKPCFLLHLLDQGFSSAVFLDPDILVTSPLTGLLGAVGRHAVVLLPHLVSRAAGGQAAAREMNILQAGVANGGFLGVSDAPEARRFLVWLLSRLRDHCAHAVAQGLYFDQRWLDLALTLFEDVHLCRDPAYDVAYWNLPERDLAVEGEAVRVAGRPCGFFHFSGFDPERPGIATRHVPDLAVEALGPAAALFARYAALIEGAGHREARTWPYTWGRFDNGVPIPEIARQIYQEQGEAAARFGDPFEAGRPSSFFAWLAAPADGHPAARPAVSRLWRAVWEARPDVRRTYPDPLGVHREGFLAWTAASGAREHGVSERFLAR